MRKRSRAVRLLSSSDKYRYVADIKKWVWTLTERRSICELAFAHYLQAIRTGEITSTTRGQQLSWLWATTRSKAVGYSKLEMRARRCELIETTDAIACVKSPTATEQEQARMRRALRELSDEDQQLVVNTVIKGLGCRDQSKPGRSKSTVNRKYHALLARLKAIYERLEREDG